MSHVTLQAPVWQVKRSDWRHRVSEVARTVSLRKPKVELAGTRSAVHKKFRFPNWEKVPKKKPLMFILCGFVLLWWTEARKSSNAAATVPIQIRMCIANIMWCNLRQSRIGFHSETPAIMQRKEWLPWHVSVHLLGLHRHIYRWAPWRRWRRNPFAMLDVCILIRQREWKHCTSSVNLSL